MRRLLPQGIYVCVATNGKRHGVIARFADEGACGASATPITLTLGLAPGRQRRVKEYLRDEENTMVETEKMLAPDGTLTISCPMYTVLYLEIEEI